MIKIDKNIYSWRSLNLVLCNTRKKIMYSYLQYTIALFYFEVSVSDSLWGWINRSHVFTGHLSIPAATSRIRDGGFRRWCEIFAISFDARQRKKVHSRTYAPRCIHRTSREFISTKRGWHIGIVLVVWPRLCTLSAHQLSTPKWDRPLVFPLSSFFFCSSATSDG